MKRPQLPSLSLLVLLAAGLYLLYAIHEVLIPFALSFALAYLLNPILHYFQARGLRRDHLVLAFYLLIALLITITANSFLPAATSEMALLQSQIPTYFKKLLEGLHVFRHLVAERVPFGHSIIESWSLKMYNPLVDQLPKLPAYVMGLFPLFSLLFLVPFITFFFLADSDRMLQRAIQFCPSRYVEQGLHLISEIDTALGNYIRGVLIIILAIGTASYLGLVFLGINYALAVSTLAGLSSLIPYLGAVLGALVGALVAFFQFNDINMSLKVILLFLCIRLADETLLVPMISRHAIRLHPLFFLLTLMVGGKLFGFIGLLFAVPAACVLKALLSVAWDWYASEARLVPPADHRARVPYC